MKLTLIISLVLLISVSVWLVRKWTQETVFIPQEPAAPVEAVQAEPAILYVEKQEELEFRRTYILPVGKGFRVEIEFRNTTYSGRKAYLGTLYQPNGSYIFYQLDQIADKIIVPELVPLVQAATDRIVALDRAYIDNKPNTFTDSKGRTWRLVE